jgi:hypothetical protein
MDDISTAGGDADVMKATAPRERHPKPLPGCDGSVALIDPVVMMAKPFVVQPGTAAVVRSNEGTTR